MIAIVRPTVVLFVALTVLTGVVYPLAVTAVAQVAFSGKANGSLIVVDGKTVGSELIAQGFDQPEYFWPRPSATGTPYDGGASSGSNLGPTNPALAEAFAGRVAALAIGASVPADAITTSGSGLDPHISPENAAAQIPRVAAARGLDAASVQALVTAHTEARQLGVLGEPRVNVLLLNLELDKPHP